MYFIISVYKSTVFPAVRLALDLRVSYEADSPLSKEPNCRRLSLISLLPLAASALANATPGVSPFTMFFDIRHRIKSPKVSRIPKESDFALSR